MCEQASPGKSLPVGYGVQLVGAMWLIGSIMGMASGLAAGEWTPFFGLHLGPGLSCAVTVGVLCMGIVFFWSGWSLRQGRTRFAWALLLLLVLLFIACIVHVVRFREEWVGLTLYLLAILDCANAMGAKGPQCENT
jgi:hypothetical protein